MDRASFALTSKFKSISLQIHDFLKHTVPAETEPLVENDEILSFSQTPIHNTPAKPQGNKRRRRQDAAAQC